MFETGNSYFINPMKMLKLALKFECLVFLLFFDFDIDIVLICLLVYLIKKMINCKIIYLLISEYHFLLIIFSMGIFVIFKKIEKLSKLKHLFIFLIVRKF